MPYRIYCFKFSLSFFSFSVIAVPVAFRYETPDQKLRLFGHPNILYMSNHITGRQLYEKIDALLPYPVIYTIVLTDGQVSIYTLFHEFIFMFFVNITGLPGHRNKRKSVLKSVSIHCSTKKNCSLIL